MLALSSAFAEEAVLENVRDTDLVFLLNNLSVMELGHAGKEIIVSLYAVLHDFGECDETPESCPGTKVYVAVSEFGELPEQRLYLLPSSHNWKFLRWDAELMASSNAEYLEFTMQRDVPAENPATGWWRTERYKVRVSLKSASMNRLPQ